MKNRNTILEETTNRKKGCNLVFGKKKKIYKNRLTYKVMEIERYVEMQNRETS